MDNLPEWFKKPFVIDNHHRRDFYVCTKCRGQSCGGIYSSFCPKCNGIISDPPRHTRSGYVCNTCARKYTQCKCDYPKIQPLPPPITSPTPSPPPSKLHPCCCSCTWCNYLCQCVCCCLTCIWKTSSCRYCCTSQWNCCSSTCYWSWCGCGFTPEPL